MKKKTGIKIALTAAAAFGALAIADNVQASLFTLKTNNSANTAKKMNLAGRNSCQGSPHKGEEKCYGIAKKGMNSCATAKHTCAGKSIIDGDPNEWMTVLKGNCEKIVGGSPTSMAEETGNGNNSNNGNS